MRGRRRALSRRGPDRARVYLAGQDADRDQDGEHCRQNEKCLVDLVHDETPSSNL